MSKESYQALKEDSDKLLEGQGFVKKSVVRKKLEKAKKRIREETPFHWMEKDQVFEILGEELDDGYKTKITKKR